MDLRYTADAFDLSCIRPLIGSQLHFRWTTEENLSTTVRFSTTFQNLINSSSVRSVAHRRGIYLEFKAIVRAEEALHDRQGRVFDQINLSTHLDHLVMRGRRAYRRVVAIVGHPFQSELERCFHEGCDVENEFEVVTHATLQGAFMLDDATIQCTWGIVQGSTYDEMDEMRNWM